MDERFSSVTRDHRFRPIRQTQRKVQIDKRFHGIFFNKNFQEKFTVDKRGRPLRESTTKNLRRFYHLSREERKRILKERKEEKEKRRKLLEGSESRKQETDSHDDNKLEKLPPKAASGPESDSDSSFLSSDEDSEVDLARGKGNVESSSEDEDFEFEGDETSIPDHKWGERDNNAPRSENTSRRLALCSMDWDRINASDIFVLLDSFKPAHGVIKSVTIYPSEFGSQRMAEEDKSGPAELKQMRSDENDQEWTKDDDQQFNVEKLREYQLNRLKYYYAIIECNSATTAEKIYNECDGIEFETSSAKLDLRFVPDGMEFNDYPPKEKVTSKPDPLIYKPASFVTQALNLTKVGLTWDETDHKRTAITKSKYTTAELENLDVRDFLASESESEEEDVKDCNGDIQSKADDKERAEMYRRLLLEECDKENNDDVDMEITWEPELKAENEQEPDSLNSKKAQKNINYDDQGDGENELASKAELEMIMLEDDNASDGENFEVNVKDERFSALYSSSNYAIDRSDSSFKKSEGLEKFLTERQQRLEKGLEMSSTLKVTPKNPSNTIESLVKSVKEKSIRFSKKRQKIK